MSGQMLLFVALAAALLVGVGLFVWIGTWMLGPEPEDDK